MKTISLFLHGFLLWCVHRHTVVVGRILSILLAVSTSACAAAQHLPASHCDVLPVKSGYPSCLSASEPLRSSREAVAAMSRRDGGYIGQTVEGGSSGGDDGPEGYTVKGRPGNQPWPLHMGNAAHEVIGTHYKHVLYADHDVRINTVSIETIAKDAGGKIALLLPGEALMRPDITNLRKAVVFQIKSSNEGQLEAGRVKVAQDLAALNRTMPTKLFTPGLDFAGDLGIQFAGSPEPWRITWSTTAPGVVQYRWTKLDPQDPNKKDIAKAMASGKWVDLTQADMEAHAEQVLEVAQKWTRRATTLGLIQDVLGGVIQVIGDATIVFLSPGLGVGKTLQPAVRPSPNPIRLPPVGRGVPSTAPGTSPPTPRPLYPPPQRPQQPNAPPPMH